MYIKNKGAILKIDRSTYIDQLSPFEVKFQSHNKDKYLKETYDLTFQEYVNLVYYGTKDNPKCELDGCNNNVKWLGRVQRGAYYFRFCSKSCKEKYKLTNWKIEQKGYYHDPKVRLNSECNRYINQSDPNKTYYFYVTELKSQPNQLKIGVTNSPERRSGFRGINDDYINFKTYKSGDLVSIAELERDIKRELYDFSIKPSLEKFDKSLLSTIIGLIK
jgi:hypothetical protein